jgi:hypothetical protein
MNNIVVVYGDSTVGNVKGIYRKGPQSFCPVILFLILPPPPPRQLRQTAMAPSWTLSFLVVF